MHVVLKCPNTPLLPRSFTLVKPAAQQMMVGGLPEERKSGEGGVFFHFDGVLLEKSETVWYKLKNIREKPR